MTESLQIPISEEEHFSTNSVRSISSRLQNEGNSAIEIPYELSRDSAATESTKPGTQKPMGSIWNNPEYEPESNDDSKNWIVGNRILDRKTWWETKEEFKQVLKWRRFRTVGELIDQLFDVGLNQIDPSLKEYEAPEPKHTIPGWWNMLRPKAAKLVEGIHRRPWIQSVFIGGGFIGMLTAPLPGPNIIGWLLAIPAGAAALAIRTFGWRIEHIDKFMVYANIVGRPIAWVVKLGYYLVGNATMIRPMLKGFDLLGRWVDKKTGWGVPKAERIQNKINKREQEGIPFGGALVVANKELTDLMGRFGFPSLLLTLGISTSKGAEGYLEAHGIRKGSSHKIDLLQKFDIPTNKIDLGVVAKHIAAGKSFQDLKKALKKHGYESRIVLTEYTVVAEIWKTGTNPEPEEEPVEIPHPRANA